MLPFRRTPPVAVVAPPEPLVRDVAAFPIPQGRQEVPVGHKSPPLPVPYTAFAGIGRDPAHASARVDRVQSLAMAEVLGVMGWPFKFPTLRSARVAPAMSGGGQTPMYQRFNIEAPTPTPVGDRGTVRAATTVEQEYSMGLPLPSPLTKIG